MKLLRAAILILGILIFGPYAAATAAELVHSRKIWDAAPHNAFTDLIRFRDHWICVFREGQGHVSPDGAVRVIASANGKDWNSWALLRFGEGDLRDPKICETPGGELMLSAAAALHPPAQAKHQTMTWFSSDGQNWKGPEKIGDPNFWLWRVSWKGNTAYSIGYDTSGERFVRLYRSEDGKRFESLVPDLFHTGYPNETSILFQPDSTALCLLRRDGQPGTGMLGRSKPPYTEWAWKDLGVRIGGPHMIRLPDGRLVAATRLYDGGARTAVSLLNSENGTLEEILKLPSGGDTSYPGLVWHNERLWMSYYSSHENKTSIYFAEISLK